MVGCIQDVVGNKKFLVKFEDGQKIEITYALLSCVCSKEEVCLEIYETVSDLTPNNGVNC